MKLKLGKMTSKEVAAWFGISYTYFKNHKEKKLEELKEYAEFEVVYGGINILKIIDNSAYCKTRSRDKKLINEVFDENWNESGIDTCSNVSNKIYDKYGSQMGVELSTAYRYTLGARDELYGKPFSNGGINGACRYLWCKREVMENGIEILTEFSEEEKKIKDKLLKKYFATNEEKDVWIAEMVDRGELGEAEAYRMTREIRGLNKSGFMAFKKELEQEIGSKIVKGTYLERQVHFKELEK